MIECQYRHRLKAGDQTFQKVLSLPLLSISKKKVMKRFVLHSALQVRKFLDFYLFLKTR